MKTYLILFLATGVPIAILLTIPIIIAGMAEKRRIKAKGNNQHYAGWTAFVLGAIKKGMKYGLLFGGFMSLILGSLHIWSVKRVSFELQEPEGMFGVNQTRELEIPLPYDEAFNQCIHSLESISEFKNCKVQTIDHFKGQITAKTGITWRSLGDEICFEIEEYHEGCTRIELSSKPVMRTILVDYGSNLHNVQTIVAFLRKYNAKTISG